MFFFIFQQRLVIINPKSHELINCDRSNKLKRILPLSSLLQYELSNVDKRRLTLVFSGSDTSKDTSYNLIFKNHEARQEFVKDLVAVHRDMMSNSKGTPRLSGLNEKKRLKNTSSTAVAEVASLVEIQGQLSQQIRQLLTDVRRISGKQSKLDTDLRQLQRTAPVPRDL
eukprot:TRINITY_DN4576_c0_g1_i1.p1 TRINITY_DN4576_c0_g1~~TRINITY_DN4576_c0_g1_i1.p1  ORF type:complete len:169 (+),score=36.61 TRINITY_DN4576_c0_g1_i1:296-802(+)